MLSYAQETYQTAVVGELAVEDYFIENKLLSKLPQQKREVVRKVRALAEQMVSLAKVFKNSFANAPKQFFLRVCEDTEDMQGNEGMA